MSEIGKYRALERKHVKEIQEWLDKDPANLQGLYNHIGTKRTPADYIAEYGDRFAIAAYLACDIHYPRGSAMLEEYSPFADLEGEVFGN